MGRGVNARAALDERTSFLGRPGQHSSSLSESHASKRAAEIWTASRAAIVAIAAAAVEVVVLHFGLVRLAGLPEWVSFALVQIIGNSVTFLTYKYWAFAASKSGSMKSQYLKQIVVFTGTWILNTAFPSLLHYTFHMNAALAFAISCAIFYVLWTYPLNRWWVFHGVIPRAGVKARST
ncbi:MAG: GtrA family protein [Polyangia bacterium]